MKSCRLGNALTGIWINLELPVCNCLSVTEVQLVLAAQVSRAPVLSFHTLSVATSAGNRRRSTPKNVRATCRGNCFDFKLNLKL